MKTSRLSILLFCLVCALLMCQDEAKAQFSKPVVVFKGKVRNASTLAPHYARISVREANSMTDEVTASRANAVSGHYLAILKPQTEYWLYIEGPDIMAKSIRIKTPSITDRTVTVEEDIPVKVLSQERTAKK